MYRYMFYYYYVTVLHLSGYSVNSHLVLVLVLGIILYFVISLLLRYKKASKCKSRHYKLLPHATVIVLASTSNNSLVRQARSGHKSSKRDQYVLRVWLFDLLQTFSVFFGSFLILVLCLFYNWMHSKMLLFVRNSNLCYWKQKTLVLCLLLLSASCFVHRIPVNRRLVRSEYGTHCCINYFSFFGACCSKNAPLQSTCVAFTRKTTMLSNLEKSYNKSLQLMLQACKFACAGYI